MNRLLATFFATSSVLGLLACSGGLITVGSTDKVEQELKKKRDGSPTGDGQTCSWADTTAADLAGAQATPYQLGESFKHPDTCNDCSCTAQGIMCTIRPCDAPKACSLEAKVCPDGTSVGRSGPNCEFDPCPGSSSGTTPVACTDDAKQCPDGSWVGRTGPSCEFVCPTPVACDADAFKCPDGTVVGRSGPKCEFVCPEPVACPADAKQCPDGSYVVRKGPKCEFAPCPGQ